MICRLGAASTARPGPLGKRLARRHGCSGTADKEDRSRASASSVVSNNRRTEENRDLPPSRKNRHEVRGPMRTCSLVSMTTAQPDTQGAVHTPRCLPSYPQRREPVRSAVLTWG